jgi:hypothetical protein
MLTRSGVTPLGIWEPISREPRAAADGEETAAVLSWHTHARRVRAADVSLWSLQLQIVVGSYPMGSTRKS